MSSYNRHTIVGFVGNMPELKDTANGSQVLKLSIATSDTFTSKRTGDKIRSTDWHQCVFWGKQAELAARFLRKGSLVLVEGAHKYHSYTDKRGSQIRQGEIYVATFKKLRKDDDTLDPALQPIPTGEDLPFEGAQFDNDQPF